MGAKVTVEQFVYSVFETQWLTHLGEDTAPRLPKHRYFLVRVSVANNGSTETMTPAFTIVDPNGQTYPELSEGQGVPQWLGNVRPLKASDSVQGNVVFDAPPRHYKLRVTDETGERAALIDIPLSFNSESPQGATPRDIGKQ